MRSDTRKLALMALFTAIALGIFALEAQLPSLVPVPGVKLGLANIVTLVAIYIIGKKEAGIILLMRIFLGALFAASPSTLLYSLSGGILAYISMLVLTKFIPEERMWVISAIAAVFHNAGQLLACALIVKTPGVMAYAPVLFASGIITGIFTGIAAKYLVKALKKVI